ncbi:MAG: hypothetical protein KDI17_00580 [Halioglobus sp.]|nr:hypothetical protein [Halioglobus sp.]
MTDPKSNRRRKPAKDRVLQARIPEQLDNELRGRAEQLGLSVSTIVRNVLLNTFDLVEGVVSDSSQLARALSGRPDTQRSALPAPDAPDDSPDSVIGWQQIVLNRNGVCEQCNALLPAGVNAAIGVPTGPRAVLICEQCLGARSGAAHQPGGGPAPRKRPRPKTASAKAAGRKK